MSNDYRAELQRLVQAYDDHGGRWPQHHEDALHEAVEAARTTLAQPEPEGVGLTDGTRTWLPAAALAQSELEGASDEALANFTAWFCRNYPGPDTIIHKPEWHAPKVFRAAADALARWGRPAIEPVPVSERLPGPEDCDDEDECWWFDPASDGAWYIDTYQGNYTHWLPHHALPVPQQEASK
jgi:hypothetical protein